MILDQFLLVIAAVIWVVMLLVIVACVFSVAFVAGSAMVWICSLLATGVLNLQARWRRRNAVAQRKTPEKAPDKIAPGGRNDTLFRAGARLGRDGWAAEEIFSSLSAINRSRCHPPLADDEVRRIANSAARYEPDSRANLFGTARLHSAGAPAGEIANAEGELSLRASMRGQIS